MNASEREAVKGAAKLWPYLTLPERYVWVERLRHLYGGSFIRTVAALEPPE